MPVGEVQVRVLQKRRHGQQDVGVVRRVGLELLEHDGEQIRRGASPRSTAFWSGAIAAGFEL